MFRKIFAVWIFSILFFASTASAEDYRNCDWICDYEFLVTPLVHCVDGNGNFDHNVYYFSAGDDRCLVVLCHGFSDKNGFGIKLHGQFRRDYANAMAETIAYWTRKGLMKDAGDFNYVFFNACHSGYAVQSTNLPLYNIDLVRAIDYKGVTGFSEKIQNNGQALIRLYRAVPKSSRAGRSAGALSAFLKNNNVRGFRSIGTRSSTKPEGITILYNPF